MNFQHTKNHPIYGLIKTPSYFTQQLDSRLPIEQPLHDQKLSSVPKQNENINAPFESQKTVMLTQQKSNEQLEKTKLKKYLLIGISVLVGLLVLGSIIILISYIATLSNFSYSLFDFN
jgi:hypothetical protein